MTIPVASEQALPPLPEKLKPLEREILTFFRKLPGLLQAGETGRYVVINGDQVLGTWETYQDASKYAGERFPIEGKFLLQKVDARALERWRLCFAQQGVAWPT